MILVIIIPSDLACVTHTQTLIMLVIPVAVEHVVVILILLNDHDICVENLRG